MSEPVGGNWYEASATRPPPQPPLEGDVRADVCVVGAGYTGLGAALELARRGVRTVILEAEVVGAGGSGRNGGQAHPGHRRDQVWLEQRLGEGPARALWDLAEAGRSHFNSLIGDIHCDYRPGLINAQHRPGGEAEDAAYIAHMRSRYGADHYTQLDRAALAAKLGTDVYFAGHIDHSGGHLHSLKFALGLAHAAKAAGAVLHEATPALRWSKQASSFLVETPNGRVLCDQLILTSDGAADRLTPGVGARVMPINNYIAVTEPLGDSNILPDGEACSDSRFVVRYFRKTPDGRLLFGGGETYTPSFPGDIAGLVRKHLTQVYPQLSGIRLTHAWGGVLGVTMTRLPFVRELEPGVRIASGYSGQGVMLAPYVGALLGRACLGDAKGADLLAALPCPPFPGGRLLRWPALVAGMSWYSLRDRIG